MSRPRYLLAYDIRDARRLRQVHKLATAYGWPMQYSVFICDVDQMELLDLQTGLGDVIHHGQDSVAFVDLGDPAERGRNCFDFMGAAAPLPTSGPLIL